MFCVCVIFRIEYLFFSNFFRHLDSCGAFFFLSSVYFIYSCLQHTVCAVCGECELFVCVFEKVEKLCKEVHITSSSLSNNNIKTYIRIAHTNYMPYSETFGSNEQLNESKSREYIYTHGIEEWESTRWHPYTHKQIIKWYENIQHVESAHKTAVCCSSTIYVRHIDNNNNNNGEMMMMMMTMFVCLCSTVWSGFCFTLWNICFFLITSNSIILYISFSYYCFLFFFFFFVVFLSFISVSIPISMSIVDINVFYIYIFI